MSACTVTVDEVQSFVSKTDYCSEVNPPAMLKEYYDKYLVPFVERHPSFMPYTALVKDHYGALFMFECGRIYGIRQERQRRKERRAR